MFTLDREQLLPSIATALILTLLILAIWLVPFKAFNESPSSKIVISLGFVVGIVAQIRSMVKFGYQVNPTSEDILQIR